MTGMTRAELLALPAIIDVPTAARAYGCSEWLIRQRITRGELAAVRLGRLVRIRASDVQKELLSE